MLLLLVQAIQQDFWANRGEVLVTDAVSFILAGQADPAAIGDSLTDYLKLLSLLGQYNTPEQQLQLLRVSQGVLKQAALFMRDSAAFQVQFMHVTQQLMQVHLTNTIFVREHGQRSICHFAAGEFAAYRPRCVQGLADGAVVFNQNQCTAGNHGFLVCRLTLPIMEIPWRFCKAASCCACVLMHSKLTARLQRCLTVLSCCSACS